MSRTFTSFKYHNYRLWWMSNIFASTATWMQRVAQDWVVLMVLTDQSGFAVGVVTALQFLPQLLLSIPAGMVADRFNRRRIRPLACLHNRPDNWGSGLPNLPGTASFRVGTGH